MTVWWDLGEKKAFELWEKGSSIGDILKEMGWRPKANKQLLYILRKADCAIPFGLREEELQKLTKNNICEYYCLESRVFKGEGEPDIGGMLKTQRFYQITAKDAGQFGLLKVYESVNLKVITLHKQGNVLVAISGRRAHIEPLAKKIEQFYKEHDFKQDTQEDSQPTA